MTLTSRRKRPSGFTLLEMLAAMGVLMLLTGGAFALAHSTLELSRRLEEAHVREMRILRFGQILRACLSRLPADAVLSFPAQQPGVLLVQGEEGGIFALRKEFHTANRVELSYEAEAKKLRLSHVHQAVPGRPGGGDETLGESVLATQLEKFEWQVFDGERLAWTTALPDVPVHSALMALTFRFAGDTAERRVVLEVARRPGAPSTANQPAAAGGGTKVESSDG